MLWTPVYDRDGWLLLSQKALLCFQRSLIFGICLASVVGSGSQLRSRMTPAGSPATASKLFSFALTATWETCCLVFCVLSVQVPGLYGTGLRSAIESWEAPFNPVFLSLVMWWAMGSLWTFRLQPWPACRAWLWSLPLGLQGWESFRDGLSGIIYLFSSILFSFTIWRGPL